MTENTAATSLSIARLLSRWRREFQPALVTLTLGVLLSGGVWWVAAHHWQEAAINAEHDVVAEILLAVGLLITVIVTASVSIFSRQQTIKDDLRRSQTQLQVMGQVSQSETLMSGDVETLAREVTELASRAIGCERVNVWLFNAAGTELQCIDLFEATPARHSSGMTLSVKEFGPEIAVIKDSRYVNADDPLSDPRTAGYVEPYLKPLRITSMLDASIQASGQHFGLLCFEHADRPHHWTPDEIAFACQLADKIGISIISRMRRQAEAALFRRDTLLHAAAMSATELAAAPSVDDAIRKALELISTAIQVDRIVVLEASPNREGPPILRYIWESGNITFTLTPDYLESDIVHSEDLRVWAAPLGKGRIISADIRTVTGNVKKMFEQLGIKKSLVVPVMIDGKYWGEIAFDSCDPERSWADFEIEILQTQAELIGTAIQRDRYIKELADANRIVQNTPTILFRLRGEPAFPLIYISQNIKLLGHEPAALTASPHLLQSLTHPDDIAVLRDSLTRLLDKDGQGGVVEFRLMTASGDFRWMENRYSPIRDASGRLVEIEGLLIDITEHKAAEEKIALLARTDPLTGLANRATFIERLRQSFAAARRGAAAFAVLYLDLDRFKEINDTLGHPLGDKLLITVGERLKNSVREIDLVARLGGDEFAILQTELTDTVDAGTLATKVRAALAAPMQIAGNTLRITASVGIATFAAETATPEDMLAQADMALYRAKEEGRDQYRFHTEELDVQVREQVAIAEELRNAIDRSELVLHYQPQVELSTGHIVGIEALIRWRHPTRGLLTPSAFLSVAERTGVINAIGQWVLERACEQMSIWRKLSIAPATLAVNVSPSQIKTGSEFIDFVTKTLAKWGLPPELLELDVTESILARATLAKSDVLERLQAMGIKISIDDFGTKYSSLDYLKTYRVNRLKIPQTLIISATHDPDSAAMVRAIIGIARELNVEVIAQGVETAEQWSYLTATSPVSRVQGFYYSEPVPVERAGELLRRRCIAPSADHAEPRAPQTAAT